ncbi:MAG: M48 family metalloprotease [Burkholderiales bacterium]|nr:M48 family metalloprotease [Burkholderiales bacterium]
MRSSMRFIIAGIMALIGLFTYFTATQDNPITGESQRVRFTPEQEIALGLEAAPQMAEQMGGLHPSDDVQNYVNTVGQTVVQGSAAKKSPYQFQFHVLADPKTVNAFALPGGQIFITAALLAQLQNEAQLAGVLGHEVGHVIGRHAAEHMAKGQLTQILVGAAGVAGSGDGGGQHAAMIASMVGNMINLKYGRSDELESDALGIRFIAEAGFDPRAMAGVMDILEKASGGARGGVEWLQTHPNPGNRRESIKQEIAEKFPDGVKAPRGLGNPQRLDAVQRLL